MSRQFHHWLTLIASFALLRCSLAASSMQHMRRDHGSAASSTQHMRRDGRLGVSLTLDSDANTVTGGAYARDMAQTCQQLNERQFAFHDKKCGDEPVQFGMQDLMDAYNVEQDYWSRQGAMNPWWAVDTKMPLGEDLSTEKKLRFYQSGVDEALGQVSAFEKEGLKDLLIPADKSVALDLGCGLGRMGTGLVKMGFSKVLCVDQAQTMLDAARANLQELRGQGVVPQDVLERMEFVQSPPSLICSVAPGTVDYVHSVITLQHMKPQLQVAYVEQLCDALRIGGSGFFQMPVSSNYEAADSDSHCVLKTENLEMAMHYTPKAEVVRHLEARGCKVLLTLPYPSIGDWGVSLGFGFRKATNSVFLLG